MENRENLKKVSKIGKIVAWISFVTCVLAVAVLAIVGLTMILTEKSLSISDLAINLVDENQQGIKLTDNIVSLGNAILLFAIMPALDGYAAWCAAKVFGSFSEGESPFTDSVVSKLDRFSKATGAVLVCSIFVPGLAKAFMSAEENFTYSMNFDLNQIMLLTFLICLTEIFKYGCMLQKEADETL